MADNKIEGRNINCIDCKKDFFFSKDEEAFYTLKEFSPPKRCKICRRKRRPHIFDKTNTSKSIPEDGTL